MKALHPDGKRSILGRVRRVIKRLPSTSVPITSLVASDEAGIGSGIWVPKSVQRRVWLRAQQQKARAVHLKRIHRIDW
jgi:hypothetical protein